MAKGTTLKKLNRAIPFRDYWPSARAAAKVAAENIGAEYLFGAYVATDECICEVRLNRAHSIAWAVEADCPDGLL